MKRIILFCFLVLLSIGTQAQTPDFAWAKQTDGSTSANAGTAITVDNNGNSYVTGYFYGSASFGSTTLVGSGQDIFIVKYDASGTEIWANQANATDLIRAQSIVVDSYGNSYVTGFFEGTATFGSITFNSIGIYDIFIAKYSASGALLWAKRDGGVSSDVSNSIDVDASGNCYITGYFFNSTSFGNINLSGSNKDIFVVKYDASGNVVWAKKAGGGSGSYNEGTGISVDNSGNSYVTGNFEATLSFGSITLTSNGFYDLFVAKYDASGVLIWAKKAGGNNYDNSSSISTDGNGNCFVTGYFISSANFDSFILNSSYEDEIFVAKYDPSGNVLWAKKAGGSYSDHGKGISTDGSGNCYITGEFRGSASFGSTTLTSVSLYNWDIFIAKYDALGTVLWAKSAGGSNEDVGRSITADNSGNCYITGHFQNIATFGNTTLTTNTNGEVFVSKVNAAATTLTTGIVNPIYFCQGSSVIVPFTSTGAFNSGNVFSAQLSDGSGNFASPIAIGTLTAITSGSIATTIPANTTAGSGYRIRVIASNPSTMGTDNGSNLTINAVAAVPTVTPSTASICSGSSITLTASSTTQGSTYNWYSSAAGNTVLGTGATFTTPVLSASTTYYVAATANGCPSSRSSRTVSVLAIPAAPATTGASRCGSGSVNLTATSSTTGGTYRWYTAASGGTAISGATTATYTTPVLSTSTTYYVASVTSSGCEGNRTSVTAIITNGPIAAFAYSNTTYCQSGTNPPPILASGATAGTFSSTSGLTIASNGTINLANSTPGTYTITNTVPASGGCAAASATFSVTITSAPLATFSYASATYCKDIIDQSPLIPSGSTAGTFSSSFGLSINASTGVINLGTSNAGTYTVTNTLAASGGCAGATATTQLTIFQPSYASAGPDQLGICGTTTATMAANSPAPGIGQWTVIGGTGGSFANSAHYSSSFSGTTGVLYTLRWTVTSVGCPNATDELLVQFNELPTATAGPDQTLCGVTNSTLAANSPNVGTGKWTIISGTGGSFTNSTSPTSNFSGIAGQTYIVRWTVSSFNCPAAIDEVQITFVPTPVSSAGADQVISCGTTSTTLAATPAPTGSFGIWAIVTGTGGTINNPSSPTSTFTGTAGISYTLSWTLNTTACPSTTDEVYIQFNSGISSNAGPDQNLCGITTTTLAASNPSPGTGQWTVVSGAGGSFASATSPTTTFSGSAGVTYTLRWTVSKVGCPPANDNVSIQFTPSQSLTTSAGPNQYICGSTSSTLAATSAPSGGSGQWTITSGTGGTIATPASSASTFTGQAGQVYTLTWTVTNSCSSGSDQVQITFRAPITVSASPVNVNLGSSTNLSITNPVTGFTYTWSGTGLSSTTGTSVTATPSTVGTHSYTVTASSTQSCVPALATVTVQVTSNATLATSAISPLTLCQGATVTVPFTAANFNVGNVFTAQLSSATGSFASPVTIGTLSGTASGTISAVLPTNAAAGTAYRIRVVASSPVITGADNGSNLTIKVLPVIPSAANVSRCGPGPITLSASGSGSGITYRWYNATTAGTLLYSGASYAIPLVTSTTTYYVEGFNGTCSSNRRAVQAIISPVPSAPVASASSATISLGSSTTLMVTNPIAGLTYYWSGPDLATNLGTSVTATPTNTGPQTYSVTIVATGSTGCASPSSSLTVQVSAAAGIATTGLSTGALCQSASIGVPFTAGGTFNAGNIFTAQLSDATGSFAIPVNIGTLTSTTAGSIAATLPASALGSAFRIRVISSNPAIIGTDNGANLTISSKPTTPTATTAYFCNGSSGSANLTVSGGGTEVSIYNWYAAATGGTVLYTGSTYTTPVVTSSTTYYVAAINASGCESATRRAAMVYVTPAFTVSANAVSPSIQSGSSTTLTATASTTGVTYTWSPASGLSGTTGTSVTASPSVTTTYTLTGTKATCTSTTTVTVTVTCAGAMSGAYTVNKTLAASATNFTSFATLASKLNSCGVAGSVTVNVAASTGPYTEQVEFLQIPGSSSVNTITLNGNGNTLQFAPSSAMNYLVRLNGTDYFRLQNLVITSTSSTLGNGIHLYNGAEHNIISGCTINLSTTATIATTNGIVASASITSANTAGVTVTDLQLLNNTINGGYYGFSICGDPIVKSTGITLSGNTLSNTYYAGAYLFNLNAPQLIGNTIAMRSSGYVSGYGLFMSSVDNGFTVLQNRLTNFGRYGMYLTNCNSLTGTVRAQVVNNMIGGGVQNSTAATNGLYLNNTDRLDLWYNSVNLDQGFTNSAACYILASSVGLDVRNNSFAFTGTAASYAFYSPSTSLTSLDYNNYFSTGTKFAYLSADKADLAILQAAAGPGGHDLHSYQGNPNYVSITNLHVQAVSSQLANRAQVIAGVTVDLDGNARASSPDIGADEYATPAAFALRSAAGSAFSVEAYPNPFKEELNLHLIGMSTEPVSIVVTDILGRILEQKFISAEESKLNTSQWTSGVYLLIIQQEGVSKKFRVVKSQ